ncbi:hypothetical protein HPP92_001773 [Vanilla planifolia]|uniref:Uncharacterized protein n=1 Tax=Vanilla planifolia TaxID=51239 RepID=A0A835VM51_VANPL|nr:hypothetical protein HPP92_001773 [Vanilla planifolia]
MESRKSEYGSDDSFTTGTLSAAGFLALLLLLLLLAGFEAGRGEGWISAWDAEEDWLVAVVVAVDVQREAVAAEEEAEERGGFGNRRGFGMKEEMREASFERRQLQPTSTTTAGCFMEKRRRPEDDIAEVVVCGVRERVLMCGGAGRGGVLMGHVMGMVRSTKRD